MSQWQKAVWNFGKLYSRGYFYWNIVLILLFFMWQSPIRVLGR